MNFPATPASWRPGVLASWRPGVLASKVAKKRGVSIEQAIEEAIAESARQAGLLDEGAKRSKEEIIRQLDELSREFAALPVHDTRSIDEIAGYDEIGIPR